MSIFEAAEYNGQVRQCAPKIKMMGGALWNVQILFLGDRSLLFP